MYVILVNRDNTMVATQKENIMQRSKLVDKFCFLVQPTYEDLQIVNCTALLEYVLPVSRKYSSETLVPATEDYKGYLQYFLPIDTNLTAEPGNIELTLTFLYVGFNDVGEVVQRVRKTFPIEITVHMTKSWSDVIPDNALSAIDQRIIKTDAQIKALQDMGTMFELTKADNLKYYKETAELQLLSGDVEIGDKVKLQSIQVDGDNLEDIVDEAVDEAMKEGVPIVDFENSGSADEPTKPGGSDSSTDKEEDDGEIDNVVDFGSEVNKNETDNVVEF